MDEASGSRHVALIVLALVGLSVVVLLCNALALLVGAGTWYHAVGLVGGECAFGYNFARDGGIPQVCAGAALVVGARWPEMRFELWALSAAGLATLSVLHVWELNAGVCAPSASLRRLLVFAVPTLLSAGTTAWAWRNRPVDMEAPRFEAWRGPDGVGTPR